VHEAQNCTYCDRSRLDELAEGLLYSNPGAFVTMSVAGVLNKIQGKVVYI